MEVTGRRVAVTGGTSGLGAAVARELASRGAQVAVLGRNAARGEEVVATHENIAGFQRIELEEPSTVDEAFSHITTMLGGPPVVVVHCAGDAAVSRVGATDPESEIAEFRRIHLVNAVGTYAVVVAFVRALTDVETLEQSGERGVIVLTSSAAAFDGQAHQAAYAASKGAVNSMVLPLARELGSAGIRVVGLVPGAFDTPLLRRLPEHVLEVLAQQTPYPKRLGLPEEFAKLVVAAVTNPMVNGSVVRIDGGLRLT